MLLKMSCKDQIMSKSKHYTTIEKKVFLQILETYKHVIECKKSDGTTLKDKDVAWSEITHNYNQSTLICHERTVQQLKKLWANLKQIQREALTKEKQSIMATGGGSQRAIVNIDPDIANIAPHLMKTAPVLFTSNMTEKEVNDKRELVFELISTNDNVEIASDLEDDIVLMQDDTESTTTSQARCNKELKTSVTQTSTDAQEVSSWNTGNKTPRSSKRKRKELLEISENVEEEVRIQRLKRIMDQEERIADVKLNHEKRIAAMKEEHLKKYNDMQLQHLTEMQNLEIVLTKAKLKNIDHRSLTDKENIDF